MPIMTIKNHSSQRYEGISSLVDQMPHTSRYMILICDIEYSRYQKGEVAWTHSLTSKGECHQNLLCKEKKPYYS